jgi:hypothetical protein
MGFSFSTRGCFISEGLYSCLVPGRDTRLEPSHQPGPLANFLCTTPELLLQSDGVQANRKRHKLLESGLLDLPLSTNTEAGHLNHIPGSNRVLLEEHGGLCPQCPLLEISHHQPRFLHCLTFLRWERNLWHQNTV